MTWKEKSIERQFELTCFKKFRVISQTFILQALGPINGLFSFASLKYSVNNTWIKTPLETSSCFLYRHDIAQLEWQVVSGLSSKKLQFTIAHTNSSCGYTALKVFLPFKTKIEQLAVQ